jgi:Raf kinase inhibitor-like YbhB/YbcL family protein
MKSAIAGILLLNVLAVLTLTSDPIRAEDKPNKKKGDKGEMILESLKMKEGEPIPVEFTGDGADVSPPLHWKNAPKGTKSFALVCDDPDAPTPKPWVHWIIYDLPAELDHLPEGLPRDGVLNLEGPLKGVKQGLTGWKQPGYRGPSPPKGKPHHYHFKLLALDAKLDLKPGASKEEFMEAVKGRILDKTELVVTYQRK